jgi:hypothetical protein
MNAEQDEMPCSKRHFRAILDSSGGSVTNSIRSVSAQGKECLTAYVVLEGAVARGRKRRWPRVATAHRAYAPRQIGTYSASPTYSRRTAPSEQLANDLT